jgi:hypothetical protein
MEFTYNTKRDPKMHRLYPVSLWSDGIKGSVPPKTKITFSFLASSPNVDALL